MRQYKARHSISQCRLADARWPADQPSMGNASTFIRIEERAFLDAYKSGRVAHAWLIGGPPGIGKATLAYRMARLVLAHPDAYGTEVQARTSHALARTH